MDRDKLGSAPNYTGACIVMFGVNLGWVLLFLFAVYGLVAAVFICLVVNHWIKWVDFKRREADQAYALPAQNQN